MPIDPRVLSLLVCPACRELLAEVAGGLRCSACRRIYPIRNGIPVLLIDQAILDDAAGEPKF